jgi:phosphatidylglycerol:prolipoprotein diacylglycerol transferase
LYPYVDIGPVRLGTYGICLAAAFLVSWAMFKADLIRHRLSGEMAGVFVVVGALAGLVGAKLYFLIETAGAKRGGLIRSLLDPSGLSWFGGLILGTAVVCLLTRIYKIPLLIFLDLCAPTIALDYAFGRLGCFLAGDGDYGKPTSLPWGLTFPRGTVPTFEAVHPTCLYEALFAAGLSCFLWRLGGRKQPGGLLAGLYLTASGIARFTVEFIKLNPRVFLGMTNPQIVSLLSILAGGLLLFRARAASAPISVPQ